MYLLNSFRPADRNKIVANSVDPDVMARNHQDQHGVPL